MSEWIKCNERLPEAQELVLVAICDTTGDTAFRYTSVGWMTSEKEYWIVDSEINNYVTHWMPLPDAPEVEE